MSWNVSHGQEIFLKGGRCLPSTVEKNAKRSFRIRNCRPAVLRRNEALKAKLAKLPDRCSVAVAVDVEM